MAEPLAEGTGAESSFAPRALCPRVPWLLQRAGLWREIRRPGSGGPALTTQPVVCSLEVDHFLSRSNGGLESLFALKHLFILFL